MLEIANLEIHVAHVCNLTCESCSHYSNQNHKGLLDLAEAERWMALWSARLRPRVFSVLGGEPTIHPELAAFVTLVRKYWPSSHLRLVTNGFFLNRHPDLPGALQAARNHGIYLSVHHDSPEYRARLNPQLELLRAWKREFGIRVETTPSFNNWTRRYHGFGAAMEPFQDGQPRQSWERCPARRCPQIFEEKIWKCGPLAYLKLQNAKYGLSDSWKPYLAYKPLESDCSDAELVQFFGREDEAVCGMCPSSPQRFAIPLPLPRPVRSKLGVDGQATGQDPLQPDESEQTPLAQAVPLAST
jgi:MoaA/NifB/PqqE/SkfB family radical SAM enzyme